jgi:acyl-coenzyme A synthetase/AMP-(fatty) acid ligase
VFSISASFGDEKLGVVAEVAGDDLDLPAIVTALRQSLFDSGLSAATIALVPPRALPKTSSGKTQRAEARAQLLAGALPILHRVDTL